MNPRARRDDVIFTEVDDQVVAYDTRAHVTHCLNPVAALVWRLADGTRDFDDLAAAVADLRGAEGATTLVAIALDRLRQAELLEGEPSAQPAEPLATRRQVMRTAGIAAAAAAAALVTTVAVPHPAAAISCLANSDPCNFTVPCCPGCICITGFCIGSCA